MTYEIDTKAMVYKNLRGPTHAFFKPVGNDAESLCGRVIPIYTFYKYKELKTTVSISELFVDCIDCKSSDKWGLWLLNQTTI